MKQFVKVEFAKVKFKIPEFINLDSNCPESFVYMIYDKDCLNIYAAFENPNNFVSSLENGFLYAKLLDGSVPVEFTFCLKVSSSLTSVSVPNLILKTCNNSTFSPTAVINKNQTAYAGAGDVKLEVPVFINTDQDCSVDFIYMIYDEDCFNLSTVFENPDKLASTLQDGFLYAKLINGSFTFKHKLCLKI